MVGESAAALIDQAGAELVLAENVRQLVAHGRAPSHGRMTVVLDDDCAVAVRHKRPREHLWQSDREVLTDHAVDGNVLSGITSIPYSLASCHGSSASIGSSAISARSCAASRLQAALL